MSIIYLIFAFAALGYAHFIGINVGSIRSKTLEIEIIRRRD